MKRAILLSGGVDSSAIAFLERPQLAIVVDYGQLPAVGERRAAHAIANSAGYSVGNDSDQLLVAGKR